MTADIDVIPGEEPMPGEKYMTSDDEAVLTDDISTEDSTKSGIRRGRKR